MASASWSNGSGVIDRCFGHADVLRPYCAAQAKARERPLSHSSHAPRAFVRRSTARRAPARSVPPVAAAGRHWPAWPWAWMPSGRPFSCSAIGSEIAGSPHRLASGVKAKLRHRLPNQSSTDGLSDMVRYSVVPTFGVGSAVIGVRMISHSSKNAPKPRDGRVEDRLHARPLGERRVPAGFPDPDVDRLDEIRRRPVQPACREHVADHDRKIADVAGGLGVKGGAIIDRGQRVIDVMAEAFEEFSGSFEFGGDLRASRDSRPIGARARF